MRHLYNTLLVISLIISSSCKHDNRYIDARDLKEINLKIQRFDKDFNKLKTSEVDSYKKELKEQYPIFFPVYNQGVIRIGDANDTNYNNYAKKFLYDSIYIEVYDTVMQHFQSLKNYEKDFSAAFSRYHALFPKQEIPHIYAHVSGFNEAIVVADSTISISLDNYLGENHVFYKRLGIYQYQLKHKNPSHLVSDAMRGWLSSEWEVSTLSNLLDRIIYEGKILFILEQILPDTPINQLIGISKEQLEWCKRYEANTWKFMIEKKHLFSNRNSVISKYLQDGPFFNYVGSGSSPMVGKYIGWKIVKSYMKANTQISIMDLINKTSAQEILEESKYRP